MKPFLGTTPFHYPWKQTFLFIVLASLGLAGRSVSISLWARMPNNTNEAEGGPGGAPSVLLRCALWLGSSVILWQHCSWASKWLAVRGNNTLLFKGQSSEFILNQSKLASSEVQIEAAWFIYSKEAYFLQVKVCIGWGMLICSPIHQSEGFKVWPHWEFQTASKAGRELTVFESEVFTFLGLSQTTFLLKLKAQEDTRCPREPSRKHRCFIFFCFSPSFCHLLPSESCPC